MKKQLSNNLKVAQRIADHIQLTPQEADDPFLSARIANTYALVSIAESLEKLVHLQEEEADRKATTPEGFGP